MHPETFFLWLVVVWLVGFGIGAFSAGESVQCLLTKGRIGAILRRGILAILVSMVITGILPIILLLVVVSVEIPLRDSGVGMMTMILVLSATCVVNVFVTSRIISKSR